jgi:hypothetical protein
MQKNVTRRTDPFVSGYLVRGAAKICVLAVSLLNSSAGAYALHNFVHYLFSSRL